MRGFVPPDPETQVSTRCYGIVYTPRQKRPRFPASTVTIVKTEQEACDAADAENNYYAAKLIGPSKSSEGLLIYYLVEWL